jgi:hypothetical protein
MRIDEAPRWPRPEQGVMGWTHALLRSLTEHWGRLATQVNALGDGRIASSNNAYTAAPSDGNWKQGDFVRNSAPAEAGSGGSKYVITGWICTVSGVPGTWVACRSLTGN